MATTLRRGIYYTEYGNAAYVSGPNALTAFDLDMAERIPIAMVTGKLIREAEDEDLFALDNEDDDEEVVS